MCTAACTAIIALAALPSNRRALGREGVMHSVITTLRQHQGDGAVCDAALLALAGLTAEPLNQGLLLRYMDAAAAGGDGSAPATTMQLLLTTLQRHEANTHVASSAFRVIAHLAGCKEAAEEALMCREGAVAAAVAALERQAVSKGVADGACEALAQLLRTPAALEQAHAAGAVQLIVAAMATHDYSAAISQAGCATFAQLALLPAAASTMMRAGAFLRISAAFRHHAHDPAVVAAVCEAAAALAAHRECRLHLECTGVVSAVVTAVNIHIERPGVLGPGLLALARICDDEVLTALLLSEGVVPTVVAAVTRCADFEEVCQRALEVLRTLYAPAYAMAAGAAAREVLLNSMSVAVASALGKHGDCSAVATPALKLTQALIGGACSALSAPITGVEAAATVAAEAALQALLNGLMDAVLPLLHSANIISNTTVCTALFDNLAALCTADSRRVAIGLQAASIIAITQRSERCRGDASTQQLLVAAWLLLRNLAASAANASVLLSAKAADCAVAALNGCLPARCAAPPAGVAKQVEHACSVIASLFSHDASALPAYDGMTAVTSVLQRFVVDRPFDAKRGVSIKQAFSTDVAAAAFAALDALSASYERHWDAVWSAGDQWLRGLPLIGAHGSTPATLVDALSKETESARVCQHACKALASLKGRHGAWWTDAAWGRFSDRPYGVVQQRVKVQLLNASAEAVVQKCFLRHVADEGAAAAARAALATVSTITAQ